MEPGEDFEISIYPSVPVEADGFCSALSPTANTSSPAWGILGVVKMNRDDLLIKYMDHHGSALITDKVFSVLGFGFIIVQTRGGKVEKTFIFIYLMSTNIFKIF